MVSRNVVRALAAAAATTAVVAFVPPSAGATPASGVTVLGVARSVDALTVTVRCTALGSEPCRVAALVRNPERPEVLLGRRVVLIPVDDVRAVQIALPRRPGAVAAARQRLGLTIAARQGQRRLGSPYRRVVRPQRSLWVGLTRIDGSPQSTTVKVQFTASDGCLRRVTLTSLVQRPDGVEVRLQSGGSSNAQDVCAQAFRTGCVTVQLDAPLGSRSVWSRADGVLVSPPPRGVPIQGYGPERWDSCPTVALGQTVDA